MSAGSHTEPGGYTGEGRDHLHLTIKGRRVEILSENRTGSSATGQFEIADDRPAAEIATLLRRRGFDPVWKDWDEGLMPARPSAQPHADADRPWRHSAVSNGP
jgi:2-iminoacetate synthase